MKRILNKVSSPLQLELKLKKPEKPEEEVNLCFNPMMYHMHSEAWEY